MGEMRIRSLGQPGDLGWIVQAHGELYAAEFGWSTEFEAFVAGVVAEIAGSRDTGRERTWIAELDGRRVGCVSCVAAEDPATARLRILLVHPDARGQQLGRRLTDTCLAFARGAGYRRIRLMTFDVLAAARRIYVDAGFELVEQRAQRRFGADLLGQDYELDLLASR